LTLTTKQTPAVAAGRERDCVSRVDQAASGNAGARSRTMLEFANNRLRFPFDFVVPLVLGGYCSLRPWLVTSSLREA